MASDPMIADERPLLELLAASDDGASDALLLAHGFTVELMVDAVRAGIATATAERTFAAGKPVQGHAGADHRRRAAGAGGGPVTLRPLRVRGKVV
jgi:hypothetical protein